jgi:peroxiredoxin
VAYDEQSLLQAKMLHDLELPFPLLLDRKRTAYAAWGLGRTNLFGAMLSPSLNWRYFRLLLAGERFLGIAPDMFQLGGDFVVDARGMIRFAHRMRNNGDRAPVASLFEALRTPEAG